MVTTITNMETAQVLNDIKSGQRKPQEFFIKKDKLASQGVDVGLVDRLLREKGHKPQGEDVIPYVPEWGEKVLAETETLPIAGMIGGGFTGLLAGGGLASLATGTAGAGVGAAGGEALKQKLRVTKGYQKEMELKKILKEGIYGAGAELAGAGIVKVGSAVLRPILTPIAAAGMNVSKLALARSLARPFQVITSDWNNSLMKPTLKAGQKITSAINALKSISGKTTRKEINALANVTTKRVSTKGLPEFLNSEIIRLNKIKVLPQITGTVKKEIENIVEVLNKKDLSLETTHALIKYIDSVVSYGKQGAIEALKGSPIEAALIRTSGVLAGRLKTLAPEYAKAAGKSREFFELYGWAKTKLGDISGAKAEKLVERINKLADADKEFIKRLSDAVPNKLKFWDWVLDLGTKEEFGKVAGGNIMRQILMQVSKIVVPPIYYTIKAGGHLVSRIGSRAILPAITENLSPKVSDNLKKIIEIQKNERK